MPYSGGGKLPAERASKLGHLDVLKSPLVQELCRSFEDSVVTKPEHNPSVWEGVKKTSEPASLIFGVDGSMQILEAPTKPHKALAFVKTALITLDQNAIALIDTAEPHPFAIRDTLENSQVYHATVFPLRFVYAKGESVYNSVRRVIYDSFSDPSLDGQILETLKWLAYEKWGGQQKSLPKFQCPHCDSGQATLPYDADLGACPDCSKEIYVSDMLGFHLEMSQDAAPDSVASAYMGVHETLLLFTGIRYYWENRREILPTCLFVKDGPLSIRAQYSKLVNPIRRFLAWAKETGTEVCILGQEKSGAFWDHFQLIGDEAPSNSVFVPGHKYIREQIQHRSTAGGDYGRDTNYGAKVFLKLNERQRFVLNVPTGTYIRDPKFEELIGASRIFATIPTMLSAKYEDALLPIELAHAVASLSTYPSAKVLGMFAEASKRQTAGKK